VLASHDSETVYCTVSPVPLTVSVLGEFDALLTNEKLPEAVPLACGANVIENGALCPAAMVRGSVRPLRLNCELVELTDEMVTLALLAVIVPLRFSVVPISTAPNDNEDGETATCPTLVPFPDSDTVTAGSDAVDVTVSVPLLVPAAVGVNATVRLTL
jgi:hypothetical protein